MKGYVLVYKPIALVAGQYLRFQTEICETSSQKK